LVKKLCAIVLTAICLSATASFAQNNGAPPEPPGSYAPAYSDPLAPFNEKMFWFNLKVDQYVLHPVASGYAFILPQPARESVGHFFANVNFIPRFANNLFQLHVQNAGEELARFGINSTLGVAGFFDVADSWFGLKQHNDDMGLTLGHYGIPEGYYIVWPLLGPSTVRDTIGYAADSAMWPLPYFVPWYVWFPTDAGKETLEIVNYRSLHLNMFEDADRYAIDLYGAVQDGYLQRRAAEQQRINGDD
jgi:phospholipid-binding lipoprotein MlaA